MTHTCKHILRCARKFYRRGAPSFSELASKSGMHPQDTMDACKILVEKGYMEYTYQISSTEKVPSGVILTLRGRKPLEQGIDLFLNYLKDNWIAIAALVISIIALLQSLGVIAIPLPTIPK